MMRRIDNAWADLPLRGKALVGISLPLVILLISLVLIYITERQTAEAEEDVRRVLQVQGDIQAVQTLLAEGAASVRGYLLTRNDDFLPAYQQTEPRIEAALARLDANIRDAEVRQRLERIRPLINKQLHGLDVLRNVDLRQDQQRIAAVLDESKRMLDTLRNQIDAMRVREDALLADRTANAADNRQRMLLATLLAAGCGLIGAIVAVLLLSSGIVSRVQRVQRSARHLALGNPLQPRHHERDEIGRLGASLEEASQLLAQRERALRDNEERLRLIIEGVRDYGIFALDPQGHVTTWNAGAERIKGYSETEIIGRHFSLFYPPEQRPHHPLYALQVAAEKGRYEEEAWRQRRDGSRFWASVVITAQHDASGTLRGFSKVTRDITDRRAADIALRAAREEAENASQAKSEFLSRMSHELRTPLNSILGFAQLLDLESPRPQVTHILRAGQHLLTLINEVLDIARIEAGRLPMSLEAIDLHSVVHEAMTLISPLADEAGIRLRPLPPSTSPAGVMADRQRLIQVLLNLLSNAVKYNRPGGEVHLDIEAQGERLALAVNDSGAGISPADLQRLFRPFERLGADQHSEGTGLGLALSRNLLQAMDGTLEVVSVVGTGSRFVLTLPTAQVEFQASHDDPWRPAPLPKPVSTLETGNLKRVLCIEDNLSSQALIETLLQRRPGVQLLSSMQGQLGLDLARQHLPRVILLDINLPDMTGIEVLKRLRADPLTATIAVLMITADASTAARRAMQQAGATAILTKPIHVPTFLAFLDQHLPEPA
ncbi:MULTISPECIES: ATP-binding protein [unclassified Pseudomonas]|uniref:ATP-binding protein n=1 Tax=Pseudomonas sp. URMO17WK12:I2 TaxID=1261623 RepID=UPI000DAB8953|nr:MULTISPECIES: ATP-binding protein [unclassified Pseudomonas]PZW45249.1 PAS domain S-box-containing protein [Pseudomonas sp. URMO17WK12:I2]